MSRKSTNIETYLCAKCKTWRHHSAFSERKAKTETQVRKVSSRCRPCRREDRYEKLYPSQICAVCGFHRPLPANDMCRTCLDATGSRVCTVCGEVKELFTNFYGVKIDQARRAHGGETRCKACRTGPKRRNAA